MVSEYAHSVHSQILGDDFYIESSLPTAMTIAEYRVSRPRRPSAWGRLRHFAVIRL
jgi:hypothetical protein